MNFHKTFFICFLLFNTCFLNAQYTIPSDTATLDINNLKVKLINSGNFLDSRNGQIPLIFKSGDKEIPLIAAAGFWLGGVDPGGNLKVAAELYPEAGKNDYYPGWLSGDIYPYFDSIVNKNFNRFWSMTSEDVGLLVADWSDNGGIDNEIPYAVRAWPARGNPFFESTNGFPLPQNIIGAPFKDNNWDNKYNPLDGDYPCIRGDKAYWCVFNDAGPHTYSESPLSFPMEVQTLVSAWNIPGSMFNNTVYFAFTFRNNIIESIDSLFTSLVVDAAFGCSVNNQVACIPEEDITIFYSSLASNPLCEDSIIYEKTPGIIVVKTVAPPLSPDYETNPMSSFMYIRKEEEFAPLGAHWPTNEGEYYNYMTGTWRDGSPLQYGQDGYSEWTTPTNYAFDGSGDPAWYDTKNDPSVAIMSHHSIRLNPKEVNRVVYAISYLEGPFDITKEADKKRIIDTMNQTLVYYIDHDYQVYPHFCDYKLPENFVSPSLPQDQLIISPNPSKDNIKIRLKNSLHKIDQIQLFDVQGRKVGHRKGVNARTYLLSRNNLSAGMYFLSIKLTNGEEELRKVIFE